MGLFGKKEPEKKEETPEEKRRKEVVDIMQRYKSKLDKEFKVPLEEDIKIKPVSSREYTEFKDEYMPTHMSLYEKACNFSENILKIQPDKDKIPLYKEAISVCHLNVTPAGVASFALLGPIIVVLLGSLLGFILFGSMFFILFFLITGAVMVGPLQKAPMSLANAWRMKASNQMVICIFYIVTYMRHTSNLELAIEFAADHLMPPLSLDLKKVLWDVETEKYESIKQSMDIYLESWKKWNMEFIEAFHLIESSLYESSEDRRIGMLDKSLSVILDGTYEKMLHYAQNLKGPITMLHMLGIILPILGLVILPLVVSFMCEVKWYHLFALYNLALPAGVYYLGKNILSTRPSGYGEMDISGNPGMANHERFNIKLGKKEIGISPLAIAVIVGIVFIFIGFSPIFLKFFVSEGWDAIIVKNPKADESFIMTTHEFDDSRALFSLLGYKESKGCGSDLEGAGDIIGPFGFGAALLSIFFVIGVGVSTGIYYRLKSTNVIKIREKAKKLEREFASALFQLGNRLGDGLPAEIAFSKVASVMEGTTTGNFFNMVSSNITRLGLGVEQAIFDPNYGALIHYPSSLIESSMKVLTVSVRKGPKIAAEALVSVSTYIKEMHKVEERLKDLMAETISSMKSQIKFMTPAIAGIVIGITSMITTILGKLTQQLKGVTEGAGGGVEGVGGGTDLLAMFGDGIPTFHFQIIVGLYVVQIIYILTVMANGIEEGQDKLKERFELGKNLIKSTTSYCGVALIVILLFNIVAASIIGSIQTGG